MPSKKGALSRNRPNKSKKKATDDGVGDISNTTSASDSVSCCSSAFSAPFISVPTLTVFPESDFRVKSLEEFLSQHEDYPHLTKTFENAPLDRSRNSDVIKYQTKTQMGQEIEHEWLLNILNFKDNVREGFQKFSKLEMMIILGDPKELMEMSIQTLIKLLESVGNGKPIETFDDIISMMDGIQGTDISKIVQDENLQCGPPSVIFEEDEDMFPDLINPLHNPMITPAKNTTLSKKNVKKCVFPSSSEMIRVNAATIATPASSVFRFGGVIPPSTNKAPRQLKPGEVAFSESGSPLLLPKVPSKRDRRAERIPVSDADGKQITEIVMYRGEEDKLREFKEFVTDVRGLIATKSIKKDRIRSRVVKVPTTTTTTISGPPSASKKPAWH